MFKKNHKILCLLVAMVFVLCSMATAFATSADLPETASSASAIGDRNVAGCSIGVNRTGSTSGESVVSANFMGIATSATCTVVLKEKTASGSYITATGVSPTTQTKTVYDRASIYFPCDWNLVRGKVYKVYVTLVDSMSGATYTNTYSSSVF